MRLGGLEKISLCDYPGAVSAVVFTQGCNFNCPFCHNRELISLQGNSSSQLSEKVVIDYLKKRSKFLDAVTISGGEPTIQKGLADFLESIKQIGFKIKIDTNGSHPEIIQSSMNKGLVDYFAMDIKAPWQKYDELSGCKVDTNALKESMKLIADSKLPYLFRTTWFKELLTANDIEDIRRQLPDSSRHIVQECKKYSDLTR